MYLKETILVVDDEPLVLQLLALVLKAQDYSILQADTVELAFDFGDTYNGIIDLLITDHFFLNTTGRQVATRILQMRPSMKVLYISGEHREALRSEEHTSELQSRLHLVCRLLL